MSGGKKNKTREFFPEMTEAEIAEAMEKLFGKGDKKSRAEESLPKILEEIGKQRLATLDPNTIPSVLGQLMMPNQTTADPVTPSVGLLNLLAQSGEAQLTQGDM